MKWKASVILSLVCLCIGVLFSSFVALSHIRDHSVQFQFLRDQTVLYGAGRVYNWGFMKFSGKYLELYSFSTDVNDFYAMAKKELIANNYQIVSNNPHMSYDDGLIGQDNYFNIKGDPFTRPMINISKDCILIEDSNRPSGQQIIRRLKKGYVTVVVKYPSSKKDEILSAIEHLAPVRRR